MTTVGGKDLMESPISIFQQFVTAVMADHEQIRRYGAKFHGAQISAKHLPIDMIQKVGLQMMVGVRIMRTLDEAQVPMLPQALSRLIRHVYGADIHWKAKIDPGVAIVHGCGLIISHAATVGTGCILFQNVTLGESIDSETRVVGGPTLGRDVHVGPGATIIGPITVGDRTKIMAGAILTKSVAPDSLVRPADSIISSRLSVSS